LEGIKMEWYGYTIIIMGTILFFETIAFFLARQQIKLMLKCFIFRKKNYIKYTELTNHMKTLEGIAHFKDGEINTGSKTYSIKKEDVFLLPNYNITEVVISENTGTSINPSGDSNISPVVVDGLIKRVKATALGESLKIIKMMVIALGILGLSVVVCGYLVFRVYTAVEEKGIKIGL